MEFLPTVAGCRNFVNADMIARGLSPLDVDAAAMGAGRLFLQQIRAQMAACRDFAFETTLSGLSYLGFLRNMRENGYQIRLYYLWIPTIDLALKRIAERVLQGGHDVPKEVVRRRFSKGLSNLFRRYLTLTDYGAIFDNSSTTPVLVWEKEKNLERIVAGELFARIQKQAEGLS